jgi:hypothetical protein
MMRLHPDENGGEVSPKYLKLELIVLALIVIGFFAVVGAIAWRFFW